MNSSPRHTLTRIIAQHGRAICDSPKRLESLLRDLCGAYRREVNILVGALEERVAADLMRAGKSVPREMLLAQLAGRLQENLAYTPEAARWAVDSWAVALGVLSEAEFEERVQAARATDARSSAPRRTEQSAPTPNGANPAASSNANRNARRATRTLSDTTAAAPPQISSPPRPTPQRPVRQPAPAINKPSPSPPVTITPQPLQAKSASPSSLTNYPSGTTQPAVVPRASRRGLTLRGCLVGLVLIVALIIGAIFVVPAIITVLREEQSQPSINEPRIN